MTPLNAVFVEAANEWDLDTLYNDLASSKGRQLTPVEKIHLKGLLCGLSPAEIAEKLHKDIKGVESGLCSTIYQYVKSLVGKSNGKVENWRNITEWLEGAGYKKPSPVDLEFDDCLPLKFQLKRANVIIDKNQVIVDLNLRIISPRSIDISNVEVEEKVEVNGETNGEVKYG
jgi:hypothetical protein